jgi:hypothetical protein
VFASPKVACRFEGNRAAWGEDRASDAKDIVVGGYPIYGFRSGEELFPVVRAKMVDFYGNVMVTDSSTVLSLKGFTYAGGNVDATLRGNTLAVVKSGVASFPGAVLIGRPGTAVRFIVEAESMELASKPREWKHDE